MEQQEAKEQLRTFFNGRLLTFTIRDFLDGEWVAECNEIPGIITGGKGEDITGRDKLIRDAIATAAGLPGEVGNIIEFKGLVQAGQMTSIFTRTSTAKAEYAFC